jgi:hypothetical protein
MRHAFLAISILLAAAVAAAPRPVPAADADRLAAAPSAGARTGKERQGGKAFDEQRVDDCKVPEARRTRARPAGCAKPGR